MGHKRSEWSLEEISYFGLQAYWGATKHGGALKITRDIIKYLGYRIYVGRKSAQESATAQS